MVLPGCLSVTAAVCVRSIPRFKYGELCISRAAIVCGDNQISKGYCLPIVYNLVQVLSQTLNIVVELNANYDQDEADDRVEAHRDDFNESILTNSFDIEKARSLTFQAATIHFYFFNLLNDFI